MSKQVIYLKETSRYNDILKREHNKIPIFLIILKVLYFMQ